MAEYSRPTLDFENCPLTVHAPASQEEMGEMVRAAAASGHAVYPVGGGTRLHLGLSPRRSGVVLATAGLNRVVDYPARDMTVTVELGMAVSTLRQLLAAEGQMLPVDCPNPDHATLGGLLATNGSGPGRQGYGTARDYLLGLTVIDDQGRLTRSGGRVVKNVAGYDMGKLHIGAMGTLGPLVQATFKLKPKPEAVALALISLAEEHLQPFAETLFGSATRPFVTDLLSPGAVSAFAAKAGLGLQGWLGVVAFDGAPESVAWQLATLQDELSRVTRAEVMVPDHFSSAWDALISLHGPQGTMGLRIGVLPGDTVGMAQTLADWAPKAGLMAQLGAGIVTAWGEPQPIQEPLPSLVGRLRQLALARQGWLVVIRSPAGSLKPQAMYGGPRPDTAIMAEIKQQLDPANLFNPGRFPGDI